MGAMTSMMAPQPRFPRLGWRAFDWWPKGRRPLWQYSVVCVGEKQTNRLC